MSHLTGGCQCGAVRFVAETDRRVAGVCHCRMCQRAVGNVFMAEASVERERLRWDGEPKVYRSSPVATRGFCANCGTPLYFSYDGSRYIDLMIGAVDQADELVPTVQCGVESRIEGFRDLSGVAEERTADVPSIVDLWVKATGHGPA
jgi:hypothetical protein